MNFNLHHHRSSSEFRENRLVYANGLSAGVDAFKGGLSQMKGDLVNAKEKAGIAKRMLSGSWNWLANPSSLMGYATRFPFMAADRMSRIPARFYRGVDGFVRQKTATLAASTRDQVGKALNRGSNFAYAGARSGYYIGAAPALEAIYGNTLRFGRRAVLDNYYATFNTLYNVPATLVRKTLDFGKESVNYVKNIFGVRNAVQNVLDGGRALRARNFREGLKQLFKAPFQPVIQASKVPIALGAVPTHTVAQLGLGVADVGSNMAAAMLTPVETTMNGYRAMKKGTEFFGTVSHETGHGEAYGRRIKGIRSKVTDVFGPTKGFSFAH